MCTTTPSPGIATTDDVERIAAPSDPVPRNVLITQCYHELSAALARRTGPRANWSTFATWASKQAGQTIRQEDPARALEDALRTAPPITKALEDILAAARRLGQDPTPDSLRDSGAADWANLSDRLHFNIDLFRAYQESPDLFEAPFTADQVAALKDYRVPGGRF